MRTLQALCATSTALLAGALSAGACGTSHTQGTPVDAGQGSEVVAQDAPSEPDASDAGGRPYQLASGGVQLLVTGPALGLQMTPANLATDVDLVDVHQEYYGVPWDEFSAGQPPPAAWVTVMDGVAGVAKKAGKSVFLTISMLDGNRRTIAPKTVITNGTVQTQPNATSCFDFDTDPQGPAMKQAYLAYLAWMMNEFSPTYLNVVPEVNLFFENCPSAMQGAVDVANAAYAAAKKARPSVVAFPSFQIEHLYGVSGPSCPSPMTQAACFDANYAQIMPLQRDRFAMSAYPYVPNVFTKPSQVPADWLTRGAAKGHETPVIAETGWGSNDIVAQTSGGTCTTVETSTEADTAAYLSFVLSSAQSSGMDLVDWWDDRDLVTAELMTNCPCTFDASWCGVLSVFAGTPVDGGTDTYFFGQLALKAFGTMGVRDYAGNPKPTTFPIWQAALASPRR